MKHLVLNNYRFHYEEKGNGDFDRGFDELVKDYRIAIGETVGRWRPSENLNENF